MVVGQRRTKVIKGKREPSVFIDGLEEIGSVDQGTKARLSSLWYVGSQAKGTNPAVWRRNGDG